MQSKTTTIYILRHGDVYNPKALWYGRLSGFRLSAKGRRQAKALGQYLSDKNIEIIYSSPLERARETAEAIVHHYPHISIRFDDRLMDVQTPTQGMTRQQMERFNWNFFQPKYLAQGGETLGDITKRIMTVVSQVLKKYKGKTIAIISHGDPIMIVRRSVLHEPISLASIRSDYVPLARGYKIVFDASGRFKSIEKLKFPRS